MAKVLAAIKRAPPMSPADRDRYRALRAEVKSDPSTWQTSEHLMAKLAQHPGRGLDEDDEDE
jgi:hypothetical protein